ncbi:Alpha/Beta hydrolase protein [Rhodocollybia butyracea]|uniref:GPI inositol-deacylase n=1 Tax=Rhodocollybia butyracea TaxID=206335 RepID=A0A9P5UDC7_9AGAR|nr:Alpha/Beta hydrolase protein [Rhodocollybia butyracea]
MLLGVKPSCRFLKMGDNQNPSQPILKWLGSWSPYGKPSSPTSSTTDLSSPSLVSLDEALHEPLSLPRRPASAQLRNPLFFDGLTRSTLPTSSLSPPASISAIQAYSSAHSHTSIDSPTIQVDNSLPSRTSLDSLSHVSQRDLFRRSSHSRSASTLDSESNTSWWWFQSGNKDNVDTLLSEEDRADTVGDEQNKIRKKYHSPRDPIVFCHGLLGFDSVTIGPSIAPMQVMHWRGIKEVLEANGVEILITRVPATSSPIDRAKVLEETISKVYSGRSVHLIGHSMGGIDCRYLTTRLTQRKFSVLSITTIATPHRGSSFADYFLATLGKERMNSFLSLLDLLPNGGGDGKAFESLTIESMRKFNEEVPDVPGVKYFSWGSIYEPGLVDTWKWPHSVVLEKEGPNDGLVSVRSAKWGKYMGTLENVNHLDLVGWINPARFKWAQITGKQINFRPATFYLAIADMLAREVDGVVDEDTKDGSSGASRAGEGAKTRSDSPGELVDRENCHKSSARPGLTELRFAADAGEVIDDTVIQRPGLNADPLSHFSKASLPPPPLDRDERNSTVSSTTEEGNVLSNWASQMSDSLNSLTQSSSSSSQSSGIGSTALRS